MRKHRNEMIRFANSEPETKVWFKYDNMDWEETNLPSWYEDNHVYIVNDEYASLRKESIDTGRPIQVKDSVTGEWITPSYELGFELPLENYRLEPEKFKYPIYKIAKKTGCIVKFISKQEGIVIKDTKESRSIGLFIEYKSKKWIEHTDTKVWEDIKEEELETASYYKLERLYKGIEDEKNFKYPLYKRNKITGAIVKFINETEGMFATWSNNSYSVENISGRFIKHTDTDVWEDCYYKEDVKIKHPLCKRNKINGIVVKFTGFTTGTAIKDTKVSNEAGYYVGDTLNSWIEYTDTDVWEDVECDELEPEYYYKWEKLYNNELIDTTTWVSNTYAKNHSFKANGWRKIEDSKRTWEEDNNHAKNI